MKKVAIAFGFVVVAVGACLLLLREEPKGTTEPTTETQARVPEAPSQKQARVTPPADKPADKPADSLAADPIATAVPMLYHFTKEQQLETLRWMRTVPEDKIVSAFPELADKNDISMAARKQMALATLDDLIGKLEKQGVSAAVPPPGFAAVKIGKVP